MLVLDLREDRGYLGDHMGSNVITSAEVYIFNLLPSFYFMYKYESIYVLCLEVKKMIPFINHGTLLIGGRTEETNRCSSLH